MIIKGHPSELKIEVCLRNMYEYRIVRERLKNLQPIIKECENNPELKKEMMLSNKIKNLSEVGKE